MIPKVEKAKTLSVLIKELDTVFSEFIRLRDCDDQGYVVCFVSGELVFWKDCDAAHFWVRAKIGTRWDEMNVHATTRESNRFDPNHDSEYEAAMHKNYSGYSMKMLSARAHSLLKPTRNELSDLIIEYKEKVKELKRLKGL